MLGDVRILADLHAGCLIVSILALTGVRLFCRSCKHDSSADADGRPAIRSSAVQSVCRRLAFGLLFQQSGLFDVSCISSLVDFHSLLANVVVEADDLLDAQFDAFVVDCVCPMWVCLSVPYSRL